tara:strand:- start:47 stop:277 length:231 start_codon:yes stop_codon:yes gene_type:complete
MNPYKSNKVTRAFFAASLISILISIYLFISKEDKSLGIFVGLWAPTLMALSNRYGPVLRLVNADVVKETLEKGTKV